MLKPIPQEEPGRNQRKKRPKKGGQEAQQKKNLPKGNDSIIELTGKKLILFSMQPDGHSDQEIAQIIYDMHRSILHLQRKRNGKKNKGKN